MSTDDRNDESTESTGAAPFTLDDANELRRAIGASVRAIRRSETTPEGQLDALGYLARDGAQSIARLARLRDVRHQSMSATVAELEAQGLARREPDPGDARGVLVSLTGAGADVIRESRIRRATSILNAAEKALTPAECGHLAAVAPLLDRLVEALLAD